MLTELKLLDVQGMAGRLASFFMSRAFSSLKDSCYCIAGLNPCMQPLAHDPAEDAATTAATGGTGAGVGTGAAGNRESAAGKFDTFTYEMTGTLTKSDVLFTLVKW